MKNFGYVKAVSVAQALDVLRGDETSRIVAGGTDIIPLMKDEIVSPSSLVELDYEWDISAQDGELHIGALAPLSKIADVLEVSREYRALAEACRLSATPQLRNMGTIGGNLLQQTRCWYFRGQHKCWMKGGEECLARNGENELHSIFLTQESTCVSAHPSDPGAALMALGARIKYRTAAGEDEMPVEALFALPESTRRNYVTLPREAVLTEIILPEPAAGAVSTYVKAMSRATWGFALAGVAVSLSIEGGRIAEARVAMTGVAPIPIRATGAEDALRGQEIRTLDVEKVAEAALVGARPLAENTYKVELVRGLVKQALRGLL